MKVLYLPLNYGTVQQTGVYDAFREAGCNLEIFDYFYEHETKKLPLHLVRKSFVDKALLFSPDIIFMQIQHTGIIDAPSVASVKSKLPNTKIINWTGDVRNYVPVTYNSISRVSDYNLISNTGQIEMFKNAGVPNVGYLQIGYDPKFYYPENVRRDKFEYDISFVANVNPRENYPGHSQRMETAFALRKAFGDRFGLYGMGWPSELRARYSMEQKNVGKEVYQKSYCVLSVSHYNELNHYFSDRLLMCLACGRPTISWEFPGWESYFTDMCDLVIAKGVEDIVNKTKLLLNDRALADYIGMSGADKAFCEHTYLSMVKEILSLVM